MRALPPATMRHVLEDPALLGRVLGGPSWLPWRVLLIAMMGEPLDDAEREIFKLLTGRDVEPGERVEEFWGVIGRRGGKSFAMACLIVYLSCFVSYRHLLTVGERAVVLCLGKDTLQAKVVFGYIAGILRAVPLLAPLVRQQIAETISLTNGVDIEIRPASFRGLRGLTLAACVADEVALWYSDDSANPDTEILGALRPSLSTTGPGILCCISSPFARKGALWEAYRRDFGAAGDKLILVAQAAARVMNGTLSERVVERAYERDAAAAAADYGALFRSDIESFVSREVVDACVMAGCREIAPLPGVEYRSFVDPSGGSGTDSMTLAISHCESNGVAVLDAVRERKPQFSPDDCVAEFVQLLRSYRVTEVVGDKWGGSFVSESFNKHGVGYRVSERTKTEIYREFLPLLNSRRVELLDHQRMLVQLLSLERKTARGGRESIDHPQGDRNHDDLINSVAGSLVLSSGVGSGDFDLDEFMRAWSPTRPSHFEEAEEKRRLAEQRRAALIE
jgi:hypothetical protein